MLRKVQEHVAEASAVSLRTVKPIAGESQQTEYAAAISFPTSKINCKVNNKKTVLDDFNR